ncbi:MAG TPA: substrate-binding domain-containing protein, partial [Armatimonadota bacterium]|nr:substrate-binding domain-containing protein [Armatimonadota bacterium]
REGLKDVCAELGVKPRFTGPEDQNPEKQAEELDNVIARKPAGILIAPGNPETLKPYIDRAIEEGINVICIDTDSPKSRRLAYVGTSNYQAGVMGAHIMAKALGAKRAGERADDASGADSSGSL